ncbi:MAG: CotH kinase family protein, partial [bacterium]
MKKISVVLFLSLCLSQNILSQDFYDIQTINKIEITFAESNWDAILDQLFAAGNEDRLVGTALINGVQFDSVGVRYKGNSSYDPNRIKISFNIKLDHIIDGQKLDGYGTLKLANAWMDPSFVREVLSYEIARKYIPAGKANFTNLYINGTHLGLYTSVQDVDKFFMRTHFYSDENPRFKGVLVQSPLIRISCWEYFGADSSNYFNYYEMESKSGWNELIKFLDTLNNHPSSVEDVLNVDRHLWMLAFDILLVTLDSPVNIPQNFYLYQDDSRRFNPIIWDLNNSFGGFNMLIGPSGPPIGLSITQMKQLDPFLNSTSSSHPIISKILSNATYKKMYIAHFKTMMKENFSNSWYKTRALEIQSLIDADVQADPNKFYTYNDFLNNINNTVNWVTPMGNLPLVGLTELMEARVAYLNSRPEFQAAAPEISSLSHFPLTFAANSEVWLTAKVSNANLVTLAYRSNASDKFTKAEMFDDGSHNDGAAGDGIYGVSLTVEVSGVQYYFYAEHNEAASFSPERAEYEFHSLAASGDVVINEFMASNSTTVTDQDGEYDDWIELYNNSNQAISLKGYYLSDNGTNRTKWAFPEISIAANGYLIIWADENGNQNGLHANFKLSASGEVIYLVNADTSIIDEFTFG